MQIATNKNAITSRSIVRCFIASKIWCWLSDSQTTDLIEKLRAQNVAFEELIFPDEIHDLLRWSDWIRAYRATAEFFDRRLTASGERQ